VAEPSRSISGVASKLVTLGTAMKVVTVSAPGIVAVQFDSTASYWVVDDLAAS
jgi:hypothetical protein